MLVASRYQNIFFYYRGPSAAGGDPNHQVEDNTTKALINLLQYSNPRLTRSFLAMVCGCSVEEDRFDYALQLLSADLPAAQRFLIGLSSTGNLPSEHIRTDGRSGSRVDAAVYAPDTLLAVIEVKVADNDLELAQLKRHASMWNVPRRHWHSCRWLDVRRWAVQEVDHAADQVGRFLLEQFIDYLDLAGLALGGGFQLDDFEALRGTDVVARAAVKAKLTALWELVCEELDKSDLASLGEFHSGTLQDREHRTARQSNWTSTCVNFTLELAARAPHEGEDADQLELDVVAWTARQAAAMTRWLESSESEPTLRDLTDYSLVLYAKRAHKGPSGKPWWQRPTWRTVGSIAAPEFTHYWLETQLTQFQSNAWEKVAYHLRHVWGRDEVLERRENIAPTVGAEIRRLLPLVRSVNKMIGQKSSGVTH